MRLNFLSALGAIFGSENSVVGKDALKVVQAMFPRNYALGTWLIHAELDAEICRQATAYLSYVCSADLALTKGEASQVCDNLQKFQQRFVANAPTWLSEEFADLPTMIDSAVRHIDISAMAFKDSTQAANVDMPRSCAGRL